MDILRLSRLYLLGDIRRQIHLVTLAMAVIMLMLPAWVNAFSLGVSAFERVATDFGLTIIGWYAVALALLRSCTALPAEVENRTLYPLLARPLSRLGYLAGQLTAIVAMLAGSLLLLGLCLVLSVGMLSGTFDLRILIAVLGHILTACVLASAGLFFSTFASPALAGVLGAFIYLTGGLSNAFVRFFLVEDRSSYLNAAAARTFKAMLPNFEVFRLKDPVVQQLALPDFYLPAILLYAAAWSALFLLLANFVFSRRDV